MLFMGSISSVFDFLTFGLLILVFNAGAAHFRTRGSPKASRRKRW